MKSFARYPSHGVEPIFGITPKAFNTIDVVAAFGAPFFFANNHMLALEPQAALSMPIVRVIKTSRKGMFVDKPQHFLFAPVFQRKGLYLPIALYDTKDNDFTRRSPAAFTLTKATKRAFITFKGSLKGFAAILAKGAAAANNTIKPFYCRSTCSSAKPLAVYRNTVDEKFQQLPFLGFRQAAGVPGCLPGVFMGATAAFETAV